MKRTFIAFDIKPDAALKAVIDTVRQKLRNERITWVQTDHLHITIKFLGDTGEEQIPLIKKALAKSLTDFSPSGVKLAGLGVFKNIHDPRVIWIGCQIGKSLVDLKDKIESALVEFGFKKEERRFSPHLTLGRIKLMRQTNHLSEIIAAYGDRVFQESLVDEIIFYESRLSAEGPEYSMIEKFKALPSQS